MIRIPFLLMIALFAMGCRDSKKTGPAPMPFFVGTYTQGESKGIYKFILQGDGTLKKVGLVAESENPSFLACLEK